MTFTIHPETRPGHVHLAVYDLDRQIEFYRQVLGLRLHWRKGETAGMGAGADDLVQFTREGEAQRERGTTGLYHFAVLFPDRRELARAVARLFALGVPNYPTDHLMTETTYLDDPEGNGIELYVDTPERGIWSFDGDSFGAIDADGNPHSGREPLDVPGLFNELGEDEDLSRPAPEGTVIGHVHLHVNDIGASNDFYHGLLGFEIQGVSESVGVSFVSAGGYHHHLGLNVWQGPDAPQPSERALGLRYFTIVVPDQTELDRLTGRLEQASYEVGTDAEGAFVRDPSQNGIRLAVARRSV